MTTLLSKAPSNGAKASCAQIPPEALYACLDPHLEPPEFVIGQNVQGGLDTSITGTIVGIKLNDGDHWEYLIRNGSIECWVLQDQVLPTEVGSITHYRGFSLSSKLWGEHYFFEIFAPHLDITSTGLIPCSSPVESLIAARQFIDREFPVGGQGR